MTLVTNINNENKKLLDVLKPKILNSVRYMRKKQRSPDRENKRMKASNQNLPTDHIQEETVDNHLKSGNLICLRNHQNDPIAKANVVAFPCTDADIKDQPDIDVKEWVSVMIESKRRNSTIDFLPSRNSTKEWKDEGFTKTVVKEKKKQRGAIRPFQPQPPMPEAVQPQPPMPKAVQPQLPMTEEVQPSEVIDEQHDEEEHYTEDTACSKPQLDDCVEVAFPIVNLDPLTVKVLRKTDKPGFFVWPRREDVSEVMEKEILRVLALPTLDGREKERLVFKCC
ncbi:uncharacterized protein LOC110461826 [Mizuhopecten yessoensis]|uniref:uncharacterized protein LOC110461826 n=1 Tax=Mizuhopecten yessoensis TaxID=6573 RepID=UPI000B45E561|nr:uncharacterized protein LOC110461826 [Mizuhopecten yessoensis]